MSAWKWAEISCKRVNRLKLNYEQNKDNPLLEKEFFKFWKTYVHPPYCNIHFTPDKMTDLSLLAQENTSNTATSPPPHIFAMAEKRDFKIALGTKLAIQIFTDMLTCQRIPLLVIVHLFLFKFFSIDLLIFLASFWSGTKIASVYQNDQK